MKLGLKRLARFLGVRPRLVWFVQVAKAYRTYRILVRHGPCLLYPNQEECFWLCVDACNRTVSRYCRGQAVIAFSSGRGGELWFGECNIANAWPAQYSPGLGMEIQGSCVDERHGWRLRLGADEGLDE